MLPQNIGRLGLWRLHGTVSSKPRTPRPSSKAFRQQTNKSRSTNRDHNRTIAVVVATSRAPLGLHEVTNEPLQLEGPRRPRQRHSRPGLNLFAATLLPLSARRVPLVLSARACPI